MVVMASSRLEGLGTRNGAGTGIGRDCGGEKTMLRLAAAAATCFVAVQVWRLAMSAPQQTTTNGQTRETFHVYTRTNGGGERERKMGDEEQHVLVTVRGKGRREREISTHSERERETGEVCRDSFP